MNTKIERSVFHNEHIYYMFPINSIGGSVDIAIVKQEDINRITDWCRKKKGSRVAAIERNPFKEEIPWTRRFPFIEIDRPLESASKSNLVYDSATNSLYEFRLGRWNRIFPSL